VAGKANSSKARRDTAISEPVSSNEKIARLLAVLATKEIQQAAERVTLLRAVGFTVQEVASILGMSENHVSVATHLGRKRNKPKKKETDKKK
jgi:DNA-directed RNA polymerase specialized sigma24 family protein